jgi:hypothetical protein
MIFEGQITGATDVERRILHGLQVKPYTDVSYELGTLIEHHASEQVESLLGPIHRPTMNYPIDFPSLKNQEFDLTFKFLIEFYRTEPEWIKSDISRERLLKFYKKLLRLERILTEFKQHTRLRRFPCVCAIDASGEQAEWRAGTSRGREEYGGVYIASGPQGRRTIDFRLEKLRERKSVVMIYCQSRDMEPLFIHELIHHLQFCYQPQGEKKTEDDLKMLKTAKRYIENSWITKRYDQYLKRGNETFVTKRTGEIITRFHSLPRRTING